MYQFQTSFLTYSYIKGIIIPYVLVISIKELESQHHKMNRVSANIGTMKT